MKLADSQFEAGCIGNGHRVLALVPALAAEAAAQFIDPDCRTSACVPSC